MTVKNIIRGGKEIKVSTRSVKTTITPQGMWGRRRGQREKLRKGRMHTCAHVWVQTYVYVQGCMIGAHVHVTVQSNKDRNQPQKNTAPAQHPPAG